MSRSDPCISSVANAIMITTSNSSLQRSGTPNQSLDVLLHTMAMSGLFHVRTELHDLLVIPFLAHHPKQTNCYFLAMATLAILQPRRIVKWMYLRCHSGIVRLATCAASTNKKRS